MPLCPHSSTSGLKEFYKADQLVVGYCKGERWLLTYMCIPMRFNSSTS